MYLLPKVGAVNVGKDSFAVVFRFPGIDLKAQFERDAELLWEGASLSSLID